ncbi:MAG: bifunctional 2-polyprenyl-6-hydroxyphenol methylase/3-demethylubiquinol 3-O-methyltransferase UbiG [Alphaproteobacteria bacterium]
MKNAPQTDHFDNLSSQWWNEQGAFGVLHSMNPARISFIKDMAKQTFFPDGLKNLKVLDVGCGGGIVCEPLARLGSVVTGIDASFQAIKVAKSHALEQNLDINYLCDDFKNLKHTYDIVTCLEVVEHVDDLQTFLNDLAEKLNPGGVLILSTLNRTLFSYVVGILGAEYLTRKVPVGTHNWQKFVEPSELVGLMESQGLKTISLKGLNYSLYNREWFLGGSLRMNYLAGFFKSDGASFCQSKGGCSIGK